MALTKDIVRRFCLLGRFVDIIQKDVLLAPFTTFKIGGPAKYFAEPKNLDELKEACKWAKEKDLPVFILGGGSNILIADKGFGGLVIRLRNTKFLIHNTRVEVDAGAPLAKLVSETAKAGFGGLEWAVGIPGTVGGAVCGNAGAFGKAMSDTIKSVEVLDYNNLTIKRFNNSGCAFGYRHSIFKDNPHFIILGATFALEQGGIDGIKKRLKDYAVLRGKAFSVNQKCAGCFFKNPEWKRRDIDRERLLRNFGEFRQFADKPKISAGYLIDFLGMKGKKIGGAMVSEKHANFIVNSENAKAEHVVMLASLIKQRFFNRYGFSLENEVQLVGFD